MADHNLGHDAPTPSVRTSPRKKKSVSPTPSPAPDAALSSAPVAKRTKKRTFDEITQGDPLENESEPKRVRLSDEEGTPSTEKPNGTFLPLSLILKYQLSQFNQ